MGGGLAQTLRLLLTLTGHEGFKCYQNKDFSVLNKCVKGPHSAKTTNTGPMILMVSLDSFIISLSPRVTVKDHSWPTSV